MTRATGGDQSGWHGSAERGEAVSCGGAPESRRWWMAMLIGLAVGIAGDAWWAPDGRWWSMLAWACLASFAWCLSLIELPALGLPALGPSGLRSAGWRSLLLAGVWMGLGGAWHHVRVTLVAGDDIVRLAPPWRTPVALRGEVVSAVQRVPGSPAEPLRGWATDPRTRFICRVTSLRDGRGWRSVSGTVDVVCRGMRDDLWPGDRLQILGQLSRLSRPMNPGQRDSQWAGRLRGRPCVVWVDEPACIERQFAGRPWRLELARCRQWADRVLAAELGSDRSSLASALLLGLRHGLTADRMEPFRTTGLMHLLSLSGMHVTVLVGAAWLAWRAGWAGQRWVAGGVWGLSLLYALMTDAQAPILRATLLVQLVCWGVWVRRPVDYRHGLVVAAVGVLIWDPRYLFQIGTWLSFLAVYVLGDVASWPLVDRADPLERLEHRRRSVFGRLAEQWWRGVCRAAWVSLMVWLITLPLVAYAYHVVSPWTPLLNLLVAVPVSLAMFGGLAVLMAAAWVPLWSVGGAAVCRLGLDLMEGLLCGAESWPCAAWWVAGPTASAVAWFYVCLACARWLKGRADRRWLAMWLVAVLGLGPITAWDRRDGNPGRRGGGAGKRLECWILSVGHGNCALLRLPGGRAVLVDAGTQGDPRWGVDVVSEVLWHLGIERLDAVVVSHADVDHFNLVPGLMRRFRVGQVVVPPGLFGGGDKTVSPAVDCLARSLQQHGLEPVVVSRGDVLPWGAGMEVRVLHPAWPGESWGATLSGRVWSLESESSSGSDSLLSGGSDNSRSLVLSVRSAGRGILLPADLESPGLEQVMGRVGEAWDVVVVPHHGSRHSHPVEFARWSGAKWMVISGDRGDVSGWTDLVKSKGGSTVLHTAFHGAVRVVIEGSGVVSVTTVRTPGEEWHWETRAAGIRHVLQQGVDLRDPAGSE